MKITIAGTGYVGLSSAMLLPQNHKVVALNIIHEKIEQLNNKISPITDTEIENLLANKDLNFTAILDKELTYKDADFVIIATQTDYDNTNSHFNTSSVGKMGFNYNSQTLVLNNWKLIEKEIKSCDFLQHRGDI
jgi:UDPglucose 6-dehydrogenase